MGHRSVLGMAMGACQELGIMMTPLREKKRQAKKRCVCVCVCVWGGVISGGSRI